ncbi:ATP-binding protein [Micromonospora ureilytica]|uniref:sensor histidine kinase n=1 Tax=Micromonospora ureilytica TaxID=709868 RepID=UPI0033F631EA
MNQLRGTSSVGIHIAETLELRRAQLIAELDRMMPSVAERVHAIPGAREVTLEIAGGMLADVVESLRVGQVRAGVGRSALAYAIVQRDPETGRRLAVHPRDAASALSAFTDIVLDHVTELQAAEQTSAEPVLLAVRVLHVGLVAVLEAAGDAHAGHVLELVDEERAAERAGIARELHDRAGFWLTTAYRQLELYEGDTQGSGHQVAGRVATARHAVGEAIATTRTLVSEKIGAEPLHCLESALRTAVRALDDRCVRLVLDVNGDERRASHEVKDEIFLIVMEATRNAVTHGDPNTVTIGVSIAPHEIRARVDDDGTRGLPRTGQASTGMGLWTMRERARLLGGTLTVGPRRGGGTRVELVVPCAPE